MDAESWKLVAKSFAIAIGGAAPAIAIGKIASKGMESIGRDPPNRDKIFLNQVGFFEGRFHLVAARIEHF